MGRNTVPKGWVKISEFEALTGLNNRTVTLAIKRGSIPTECWRRVGNGKTSPICIDPKPAALHWYGHINSNHHLTQPLREKLAGYIKSFDPDSLTGENQRGNAPNGETEEKKDCSIESGIDGKNSKNTGGGDKMTLAEAQRRKEVAKAKTAELELLEKEGTLILKQSVEDQLFAAGKEIRDSLLSVPDRITDEVMAAAENRSKVNNIIYDAIAGALEKLADLNIR